MANIIVVGSQWGDEGKGKIVDLFTPKFDIIARYQGGHNAGHTVWVDGQKYVLHLVPSGIIHPEKICIIGNGVVVDPNAFLQEIDTLKELGISVRNRLLISNRSHIIMPYHRATEEADEEARADKKIGTTARGIGPAYEDKIGRRGIRMGDLLDATLLEHKIKENVQYKNKVLSQLYGKPPLDAQQIFQNYLKAAARLKDFIIDTAEFINEKINEGKSVLFEGAQGTLLDIDYGTYPFVTASNATAGGACTGTGVGPTRIQGIVGIAKAYTTRVGAGPLPTELTDSVGELIRERGAEYGASTGRPRRCGWFDAVVLRYAKLINNIDTVVLTKLDVLDELPEIKVCIGYSYKGEPVKYFPTDVQVLEHCQPVYKTLKGWQSKSSGITDFQDLPERARDYLKQISDFIGAEISIVSTGPDRKETIFNDKDAKLRYLIPL